ncbi:POK9 protein, partial [Rhinopomastus cyanomelas]|nr:POK9 protein [Rhinopomastus cyanomelas]
NEDCKRLLRSLPNQDPSLVEMVEACNRIGTADHKYKTKYETMSAAFVAMKLQAGNCYNCGKPGHLKKDCL